MVRAPTGSYPRRIAGRIRQDRGLTLLTAVVMAVFVLAVYVVVVVGGAALVFGGGATPSLVLSVLATAIVAIAFEPVRRGVRRLLSRALHQDRMSPYQVLARFPGTVTGSYPAEQLPLRMARVLAEGTGAERAEVWLVVRGRLELAACWPLPVPDPTSPGPAEPGDTADHPVPGSAAAIPLPVLPADGAGPTITVDGPRHSLAVRERGELLGALTVVTGENQRLTPVEERLFAGLAAQSGLMLRVAGLRTDLEQQLIELDRRTTELRQARRDLISRQDSERQRLERDIHDGAQQEVLALLVNLRLAQTLSTRAPERAAALLAEQADAAGSTIATLTALSRGLYPRLLTDDGPVAALTVAAQAGPIPVTLTSSELPRFTAETEAALYFCALEAVQNATKHSGGTHITIDIRRVSENGADRVVLTVADDGDGFVPRPSRGGLSNIRDRIESLQGFVTITSALSQGTVIRAEIPCSVVSLGSPDRGGAGPAALLAGSTANAGG